MAGNEVPLFGELRGLELHRQLRENPEGRGLVAFDLDGTLVDTMPALRELAVEVLTLVYGWSPEAAGAGYDRTVGRAFGEQLELLAPGHQLNTAAGVLFEFRKAELYPAPFVRGARETVLQLLAAGWAVAVVSSTSNLAGRVSELPPAVALYGWEYGTKSEQLERLDPRWFVGDAPYDSELVERDRFIGVGERAFPEGVAVVRYLPEVWGVISGAA